MKKTRVPKACEHCGKIFEPPLYLVKRGYGRFCSSDCYGETLEGKKQTKELVKKRFAGGRPHNDEWNRNIAKSKQGKKSHFWKGGITKKAAIIRVSVEYRIWRREVLKRDNHTCVLCGSKNHIQADHIKPFSKYPKLRFSVKNGRTLCKPCHKKTLTYGNDYWRKKKLKEVMPELFTATGVTITLVKHKAKYKPFKNKK